VTAFFDEEIPPSLDALERTTIPHRAGTALDHRWTTRVVVNGKVHGLYDQSQRVYQTGGELKRFVYWKAKLVTLDAKVWQAVINKADWLEIIDHERNECWRISGAKARKAAIRYNAGIGERVGVPIEAWATYTAEGKAKPR
jgi:hypothetical protein